MRTFRIYQTMYLGQVEVPDEVFDDGVELPDDCPECKVVAWMNDNDTWPEDCLEPVDSYVKEDK